jgi:hypothetical protein
MGYKSVLPKVFTHVAYGPKEEIKVLVNRLMDSKELGTPSSFAVTSDQWPHSMTLWMSEASHRRLFETTSDDGLDVRMMAIQAYKLERQR